MIGTTNAVGSNVTADILGIVIKGNSTPVGVDTIGQYVIVKNSMISDCPDGLYTAAKVIPANTTIDSTYLTAVTVGGLNDLRNITAKVFNISPNAYTSLSDLKAGLETFAQSHLTSDTTTYPYHISFKCTATPFVGKWCTGPLYVGSATNFIHGYFDDTLGNMYAIGIWGADGYHVAKFATTSYI